jgi:hypothetical protein
MTRNKSDFNSNNENDKTEYNHSCSSKGCDKPGSHRVKLVLLRKYGVFCDSCFEYLKENQLVESIVNESV